MIARIVSLSSARLACPMSTAANNGKGPDGLVKIEINEADLDEAFISGSGPGGQSVNKSVNCCQIKHRPTGIMIKCHQSRSLETNRRLARELLAQKLDNLYNGDESRQARSRREAQRRISIRDSQNERKRAMKEQYKKRLSGQADDGATPPDDN